MPCKYQFTLRNDCESLQGAHKTPGRMQEAALQAAGSRTGCCLMHCAVLKDAQTMVHDGFQIQLRIKIERKS